MHFRALVASLLRQYKVELVGIESPAYQAGPFQRIHFGLMMYSLEAIFERRLDCVLYDPATLKLLAKGDPAKRRGSMSKMDMQRCVQIDTMEAQVIDNNEADAYLIGLYSSRLKRLLDGEIQARDLTLSEQRVFVTRSRRVKTLAGITEKRMAHSFRENSRFFRFSMIPAGEVSLPTKDAVDPAILKFLENIKDEKLI